MLVLSLSASAFVPTLTRYETSSPSRVPANNTPLSPPLLHVMPAKSRELRMTSKLPSLRITRRDLPPEPARLLSRSVPAPMAFHVPGSDAFSPLQYSKSRAPFSSCTVFSPSSPVATSTCSSCTIPDPRSMATSAWLASLSVASSLSSPACFFPSPPNAEPPPAPPPQMEPPGPNMDEKLPVLCAAPAAPQNVPWTVGTSTPLVEPAAGDGES
mmetsp:Transcript_2128/g.5077  ORF Transcript_2128/g.5077 Transcript_2128/m.5077 type:complete len:213 (-) Transcript_2128:318-956(-)